MRRPTRQAGFTLVELMVASMLASILLVALFRLLDITLDLWSKGETRRALVEQTAATAELLASDLRALHNGKQGDFLCEWVPLDVDSDGIVDRIWPRLRFVRQASLVDVARIAAEDLSPEIRKRAAELGVEPASLIPEEERRAAPQKSGLIQVVWTVVPAGRSADARGEGVLLRGEELLEAGSLGTFFDEGYFARDGQPRPGTTREVTGGLLWLGVQFATQTSILWDGWSIGDRLRDTTTSWDAWNRGRPDAGVHVWNEPGAGMPRVGDTPLLPRRIRLELEFERERDRRRRTRLLEFVDKESRRFEVLNGDGLPRRDGQHILVGSEWMRIVRVDGDQVVVRRGARGTQVRQHAAGSLVHFGSPIVVEVPVALYSDDWSLEGGR